MKSQNILGISAGFHDAALTLLDQHGKIVFAGHSELTQLFDSEAHASKIVAMKPVSVPSLRNSGCLDTDQRRPNLSSISATFSELYVEGDYLVGVTDVPNTTWGNDVLEFYKSGHINQHSVGFRTIKAEAQQKGQAEEYNLIKEILLFEGSVC